jgi:hypothetical protein
MYTPLQCLVVEMFAKLSVSKEGVLYHTQRLINCLDLRVKTDGRSQIVSFCKNITMEIFLLKSLQVCWCEIYCYKKGNLCRSTC